MIKTIVSVSPNVQVSGGYPSMPYIQINSTNPTIQDLVDQIKEKQTQIEMVKILIQGQEVGTN